MSLEYRIGDVFERLAEIPDGSIDLIVTSPPFLALRSYLPADHEHKHLEIGSEATPAAFIDTLLALTAEWGRVLAPHGSLCVELGDTFSGSSGDNWHKSKEVDGQWRHGNGTDSAPPRIDWRTGWPLAKSLTGIPEAYMLALAYGINPLTGAPSPAGKWRVRNQLVWARPNPPVGALGDKFRPATSYITVACRSAKRYFDLDAVRTEHTDPRDRTHSTDQHNPSQGWASNNATIKQNPAGAPPLDWHTDQHPEDGDWLWKLSTQPFSGWTETVRHVRVEVDAGVDGSQRTTSPDCPVHGSQDRQDSSARDGEHAADSPTRNGHTDARLAPAPVDDSPPTFWSTDQQVVAGALAARTARRRSTSSNKTDHAPATTQLDTLSDQTPARTDGTPAERESSAPHPDTIESSISSDDSDASREPQTTDGTARTRTGGSCTCTYHVVQSITERNSHYATFPMALPKRLIEAMCPLRVCTVCGRPSERIVDANRVTPADDSGRDPMSNVARLGQQHAPEKGWEYDRTTLGWSDCGHDAWRTGVVLDPFAGSGTTLEAAQAVGRYAIGIDLDSRNGDLARDRVGMFMEIVA